MEMRKLGNSDVEVSAISMGAWAIGGWMWGEQDESEAIAAIEKSLELGITSIDTAAIYGFGKSEEIIGKVISGKKRESIQILTKYGLRWDSDEGVMRWEYHDKDGKLVQIRKNSRKESVILECENSLRRLGTDYIDLYQCHWPDVEIPIEETMSAIDQLLKDGKILAAGVCNYTVEQMEAAKKCLPLAASQPPYSMVNRGIEKDLIPYCQQHNIAVLPYSPLQRGLLTGKITMDTKFPPDDHRSENAFFKPANRRKVIDLLDKIRPIAEAHNSTLAQLVISWTMDRPGITTVLVGARNSKQAEENAAAACIKLTENETSQINSLLDEVHLDV